ncbi:helix-turn-helix transcriptional regulator [Sphingobacterium siyangense]|uniref:helix-turn-helix domain-containing protein n=1 Tax=Sphingobacterium siyangense TaxID=459529 RepID=UPI00200E5ADB|nr:helix-turn-helix transcriptional regulator [Sphingobacterium siyangense]UQA75635.1 helix-turn-helix transcriptional regulator [Sphingobacterium siyangense]
MNTVGKAIKLLRHQKGWTQQHTANQLAISVPAFSKIETGITDINLSRLKQISALFDLKVVQLLSYPDVEGFKENIDELKAIQQKLQQRDVEILQLQKKLIQLYDQL